MYIVSPVFLTWNNIINVLRQSAMLLIMSLGMMYAMLLGRGVDMSIGSTLALSSCVGAYIMTNNSGISYTVLGVGVILLIGILVGLLNGALIAYLKLPAILVTFGTREIVRGIAYYLMSDQVLTGLPSSILFVGSGRLFNRMIPMPVVIAAVLTVVAMFVLRKTMLGRRIYIVGANPVTAEFSGVHVYRVIISGFVVSGLMAAIAGIVYIGRLGAAEPQIGEAFAFQCVAAVAIGGTSFSGGIGSASGAVIGALILTLLINAMNLLNVSSSWQGVMNGLVIIIAVLLDDLARRQTR